MTVDAFVENVPTGTGGRGKEGVRAFYRDSFVNSLPNDITGELTHRVVGDSAIVDEVHHTFTHAKQMDWILPGVPPTNKRVVIDIVAVVYFRGDKICGELIYWDHAKILRQVGLWT
jgi:carboxymethylenebutenolidase